MVLVTCTIPKPTTTPRQSGIQHQDQAAMYGNSPKGTLGDADTVQGPVSAGPRQMFPIFVTTGMEPRDSRGPKAGLRLKIPRAGRVSVERVGR